MHLQHAIQSAPRPFGEQGVAETEFVHLISCSSLGLIWIFFIIILSGFCLFLIINSTRKAALFLGAFPCGKTLSRRRNSIAIAMFEWQGMDKSLEETGARFLV